MKHGYFILAKIPVSGIFWVGSSRYIPINFFILKKKLGTAECSSNTRLKWNYIVLGLFLSFFLSLSPKIKTQNPNPPSFLRTLNSPHPHFQVSRPLAITTQLLHRRRRHSVGCAPHRSRHSGDNSKESINNGIVVRKR